MENADLESTHIICGYQKLAEKIKESGVDFDMNRQDERMVMTS